MNSEKVKYLLSMSDKILLGFKDIFSDFSFGKKRISSVFSPFERSLSFEGPLSSELSSFRRIGIP